MNDLNKNREIIVEFTPMGNITKVTAMDTKTLIEVIISGPSNVPQAILKQNAIKRLEYVLRKKKLIS